MKYDIKNNSEIPYMTDSSIDEDIDNDFL